MTHEPPVTAGGHRWPYFTSRRLSHLVPPGPAGCGRCSPGRVSTALAGRLSIVSPSSCRSRPVISVGSARDISVSVSLWTPIVVRSDVPPCVGPGPPRVGVLISLLMRHKQLGCRAAGLHGLQLFVRRGVSSVSAAVELRHLTSEVVRTQSQSPLAIQASHASMLLSHPSSVGVNAECSLTRAFERHTVNALSSSDAVLWTERSLFPFPQRQCPIKSLDLTIPNTASFRLRTRQWPIMAPVQPSDSSQPPIPDYNGDPAAMTNAASAQRLLRSSQALTVQSRGDCDQPPTPSHRD